ncbi:ImmA/IrrE family metallo-endopeptidase [Methylobacterium sp. C25]|uniref:ImmA/IrrE family metallo-endopeptidase n=1 Tax=Methylobacterium sp. C25 TaxID=2721622 RepID=UPI001F1984C6|nr:ImmA/IrrE family metallo-endopeptidase [Methylobacterium sp. C25]MCE4225945.1 ImmA/IrrE family metallo-endopeptidase [Methylobacterium sp. C25]
MTRREAILEGAQSAARLHDRLGVRRQVEARAGSVDVFGAILALGTPLIFRPLQGLLGACLPGPGIMISTERPLPIQRFTGAHELGHVALGHDSSLDGDEILRRIGHNSGDTVVSELEVAADSFASAFLLPKWLLQMHARRQGWNRASMADPHIVYQLSLRVGASYSATCVALERHDIINETTREALQAKPRRTIKAELLDGVEVDNFFPDVWLLTERDEGSTIEGQPDDVFVLRLEEQGGAGYLWTTSGLIDSGFAILRDRREVPPPTVAVGGPVTRALTARRTEPAKGSFSLELRRPWLKTGTPLAALRVAYDLQGKEVGMPRATRRHLRLAA